MYTGQDRLVSYLTVVWCKHFLVREINMVLHGMCFVCALLSVFVRRVVRNLSLEDSSCWID